MTPLERLRYWVSRILGLRQEDFARTALIFLYLFFVLLAQYILKSVSKSLFLNNNQSEQLPFLYITMALAGGTFAYLYTKMTAGWTLHDALNASVFIILVSLLSIWVLLVVVPQDWVYYVLNVWVGLFSLVLVSQGWLVAGNVFDPRSAKRVYSLLASGAVLGAACGGSLTAALAHQVTGESLVPLSGVAILLAYGCFRLLVRLPGVQLESASASEAEQEFSLREMGASVRRYRHLKVIIGLLTVTYVVDTLADFQFSTLAAREYSGHDLTAFLGAFNGIYLNSVTFVMQIFLTPLVIRRFGIGGTLLVMPGGIGLASLGMLLSPGVLTSGITRVVEASTRYSFNRTGMELLYLPLPTGLRNRVKSFVDVFVDRLARGLGAILILVLTFLFGDKSLVPVTALTVICCVLWAALALYARREYVDSVRRRLASRRLDLESIRVPYQDMGLIQMLEQSVRRGQGRQAQYAISLLDRAPDFNMEPLAVRVCAGSTPEVRASLFEVARRRRWRSLLKDALREMKMPPGEATRPAVEYYCSVADDGEAWLKRLLSDSDPRVAGAALEACAVLPAELVEKARMPLAQVRASASSPDQGKRRMAAVAFRLYPETAASDLIPMLGDPAHEVRRAVGATLRTLGSHAVPALATLMGRRDAPLSVRLRVARTLGRIEEQPAVDALFARLKDSDLTLRAAILRSLERLRDRAPKLRYDEDAIRRQIHDEARDYFSMRAALSSLPHSESCPSLCLLRRTLDTRLHSTIQRLFQLLGLRFPPRDIKAAYKAFQKGGTYQLSTALEFLDNILDHEMKRFVLPLLDRDEPQTVIGRELFGIRKEDPIEVLRDMIRHGDLWLTSCAMAAAAELGYRELSTTIEIAAAVSTPIIKQVAASATMRLAIAAEG